MTRDEVKHLANVVIPQVRAIANCSMSELDKLRALPLDDFRRMESFADDGARHCWLHVCLLAACARSFRRPERPYIQDQNDLRAFTDEVEQLVNKL
jgi:hypothetical protein